MRIDDNAEALAMMKRALGSLEAKIREAYNKGYQDGVKSMVAEDETYTEWLEDKCLHILDESWVCDLMSEHADEWEYCLEHCENGKGECLRRLYNAESKDEPQTSCKTCRYGEVDEGYVKCAYYSKSTEQTEPQTEVSAQDYERWLFKEPQIDRDDLGDCNICKYVGLEHRCNQCVNGSHFCKVGDEPKTDCAWK